VWVGKRRNLVTCFQQNCCYIMMNVRRKTEITFLQSMWHSSTCKERKNKRIYSSEFHVPLSLPNFCLVSRSLCGISQHDISALKDLKFPVVCCRPENATHFTTERMQFLIIKYKYLYILYALDDTANATRITFLNFWNDGFCAAAFKLPP
jgi:hypothetical protein